MTAQERKEQLLQNIHAIEVHYDELYKRYRAVVEENAKLKEEIKQLKINSQTP